MSSNNKFFTSYQNYCLEKFNSLNVKELREVLLNSGIIEINNIPIEKIPKEKICDFLYEEHIKLPVTLKKNLNMNKYQTNENQHGGIHDFDYKLEDVVFVHMTRIRGFFDIMSSGKILSNEAYVGKGVFTVPSIPALGKRKFFNTYGIIGLIIKCSDWTKYTTEVSIEPHETSVDEAFESMLETEQSMVRYSGKSYLFNYKDEFSYPQIPIKTFPVEKFITHTTEIVFLEDIPLSDIIGVFVCGTLMSHKECMHHIRDSLMFRRMISHDFLEYIYETLKYDKDKIETIVKTKLDMFEQLFESDENNFNTLLKKACSYIEALQDNLNYVRNCPRILTEQINYINKVMLEFKEKFYIENIMDPYNLNDNTKSKIKQLCEEHGIPLYDNVFCHEDLHNKLKINE
jgi:hypothetical protein